MSLSTHTRIPDLVSSFATSVEEAIPVLAVSKNPSFADTIRYPKKNIGLASTNESKTMVSCNPKDFEQFQHPKSPFLSNYMGHG